MHSSSAGVDILYISKIIEEKGKLIEISNAEKEMGS